MNSERQQINSNAGIHHTLSRQILGIDWYDTESSARRVIEWLAEGQEPVVWRFKERADDMRSAWLYVKKRGHVPNGHPWQGLYAVPVAKPQLKLPDQDRYFEIVSGVFGKGLGHELAMKLALVTGTIHNEIISLNPTQAKPLEDL